MEAFSALLALCAGNSPITDEFPTQRPVTGSSDVFFDLRLSKRLNKQSWDWWFGTLSHPLWHHCNATYLWLKQRQPQFFFKNYTQYTHLSLEILFTYMFYIIYMRVWNIRGPSDPYDVMNRNLEASWCSGCKLLLTAKYKLHKTQWLTKHATCSSKGCFKLMTNMRSEKYEW